MGHARARLLHSAGTVLPPQVRLVPKESTGVGRLELHCNDFGWSMRRTWRTEVHESGVRGQAVLGCRFRSHVCQAERCTAQIRAPSKHTTRIHSLACTSCGRHAVTHGPHAHRQLQADVPVDGPGRAEMRDDQFWRAQPWTTASQAMMR